MSLAAIARWLEQREWAGDFSASQWLYPSVLAIHLTCIAIFGGMILVTNLRLLGFLRSQSLTDVVQKLRYWKRTGFVIMVTCGALLAGSEASLTRFMKDIQDGLTKQLGEKYPSSEGHFAYGVNGYVTSTPLDLVFDEQTINRMLDHIQERSAA